MHRSISTTGVIAAVIEPTLVDADSEIAKMGLWRHLSSSIVYAIEETKEHDTSRRVDHANDEVDTGSDALAEMPTVWPQMALAVLFGTQPKGGIGSAACHSAQVASHHTVLSRAPGLKTGRCLKIRAGHLSHPLLTVFTFGIHKIDVK